ncbi:MAG: aminopeptidase P family protein [Candidatus Pseudobacter hemicellulosilyticus]|uniref:Xaa-Pro aminopeptidase n=1 Tax=Candidatus Pseudobacter hemicellulosilyticus TaxID=3121375 RepID=A0AAJ6BHI6_9BACT|nr:MAG: aminopeptidase P family protein [Pseudobacter sp.]
MYFTTNDIQARRDRLAARWDQVLLSDEAVLVHSGKPIGRPGGLDQTYTFLPHPAYFWLTGRRREEEVVLYSRNTGWQEFQKIPPPEQAVWEGEKVDLLVNEPGQTLEQLTGYLQAQGFKTLYQLGQSEQAVTGKAFELRTLLDQTRRVKDAAEVRLIRELAGIAAKGYAVIEKTVAPGITEREIQVAYESEIYRQGAHTVPYDSIVGAGTNSAILHALPTLKKVGPQELVLVDAGADIYDYCVDITRTYVSGTPDSRQKALYQLVLDVQLQCMALTKAGAWWRDIHGRAATLFTQGLLELGILKGSMDSLVEKEVVSLFFPHGLGHLVGLRVRDTGHEENLSPKAYFGARLRVDLQLEPGHLITVEPGLYFIKALLDDPARIAPFKDNIDFNELAHWKNIGGVRIEDNVLVTETGNENLTEAVYKAASL